MQISRSLTYPKITVVTPNYNQVKFIEQTIQSVLNQNYPNLEYIIIDGGSTDGSVEIIKKHKKNLTYWITEPDQGMYYAINKGFSKSSGDIMCWINSDDILWEGSLHYVARVFQSNDSLNWLQGYPTVINEVGEVIHQREPVWEVDHFFLYKHEIDFSFIQQESTFWTRKLWNEAGGMLNENYKLAGDFDLWMRFFKTETLFCSRRKLGAFRKRRGQLSSDSKTYLAEARNAVNNSRKQLSFQDKLKLVIKKLFYKTNHSINWID